MVNKKANPRSKQIYARVSTSEHAEISALAEKYGYTLSEFVRFCVSNTIEQLEKKE